MNTYEKFLNICEELDHYPTESELIYKYNISKNNLKDIQKLKQNKKDFIQLNLHSQSGDPILYWYDDKILLNFSGSQDLIRNSTMNQFSDFKDSEIINGFIFSEIESSLAIEGVRSTRARIEKLNKTKYEDLSELNDVIVKNMLLGYEFVKNNEISIDNIYKLYMILSKNCLESDEKLKPGNYYRHDVVNIVDGANAVVDQGVNWQVLPKLMEELINYINQEKTYEHHLIASHIIHYYLIYLHPYFDYNGRMARVMSFWYNYTHAPSLSLLLVSESINNKVHKNGYYNAILNSRRANNDITYFLEYMGNIVLKYSKIYINYHDILNKLKGDGHLLNRSTELALKYVLAIPVVGEGYFDWKDYREFTHDEFSKQYYLKLLNALVDVKVLSVKEYKKAYLYKLNSSYWDLI